MTRFDGANLLKRRLRDAGIVGDYSPHSFRATGITNYLENGGTLEVAQRIAGHADSRTTKLYDRRGQKVLSRRYGEDPVLMFTRTQEDNSGHEPPDRHGTVWHIKVRTRNDER